MAQSVDKVLPQALTVQILAVRVDVVVSDLVQPLRPVAAQIHAGLGGGQSGILRRQHDFVDLALPRREMAVHW